MTSGDLIPSNHDQPELTGSEVQFALVIARMIDSVKDNAADMRQESLATVSADPRYSFVQADIIDKAAIRHIFKEYSPHVVMRLAAESHVDRSIDGPGEFIQTNVVGTFSLLQAALAYWQGLSDLRKSVFRFHHISTDEVGSASDHLVRARHQTYGLPVVMTNCSNNYGPYSRKAYSVDYHQRPAG